MPSPRFGRHVPRCRRHRSANAWPGARRARGIRSWADHLPHRDLGTTRLSEAMVEVPALSGLPYRYRKIRPRSGLNPFPAANPVLWCQRIDLLQPRHPDENMAGPIRAIPSEAKGSAFAVVEDVRGLVDDEVGEEIGLCEVLQRSVAGVSWLGPTRRGAPSPSTCAPILAR